CGERRGVAMRRTRQDRLTLDVAELAPPRPKHGHERRARVDGGRVQVADLARGLRCLRVRKLRRGKHTGEALQKGTPSHSITSSASASILSGICSPIALAVLRLMT